MWLGALLTGILILYLIISEVVWNKSHPHKGKGYGKRNSHKRK